MSETSKQAVERATAFEKTVLPNGLTVLVHPMPGFTGVYALYGTKFGSIDRLLCSGWKALGSARRCGALSGAQNV